MLFQLPTSALILSLVLLAEASSHGHGAHLAHMRRRQLNPRGPQPVASVPTASLGRRSCKKKATSSSSSSTSTPATIVNVAPAPSTTEKAAPTTTTEKAAPPTTSSTKAATTPATIVNVAPAPSTTEKAAPTTTTEKAAPTTTSSTKAATTSTKAAPPTTTSTSSPQSTAAPPTSGGVAVGGFVAVKPSDWPTATQAGPQPTSTVASASDPYLEELSKAIDNSGNSQFTAVHTGDMTYYGQGLGACGDVYDDNSFTAAVSHLMYDSWIGAGPTSAENRNPICGPFVPGRQALNSAGVMVSAVKSTIPGYATIGGDGLINCVGTAEVQCHVPLTATVTHGDKSIQVAIVDRCAACEEGDIDLTPAAFAALADMSLGRTSVTWQFDNWS